MKNFGALKVKLSILMILFNVHYTVSHEYAFLGSV